MRLRLLTMTMMGFALSGVLHAQAVTQVGVREVAASERGVISLATKIRYTTMIILPDTEEILDVLCGDKEFWVINASHNIAHLKPAKEGAATNLNLVTASGTVYSFLLAEGKGERAAMQFAAAASALKCTRYGGILGAPSRAEVEAFLAERN